MIEKAPSDNPASQGASAKGLVLVFTGDGKGKTSAAMGVVLRAVGHGQRVYIAHFMKGNYPSGEHRILSKLPNVDINTSGGGFIDPKNIKTEDKERARQTFTAAREAMLSGKYDLVVLDEINLAAAWKLIEVEEVVKLINDKPPNVQLILTGRYADTRIVKLADLVTEMLKIKHPYDEGVIAQAGIDY